LAGHVPGIGEVRNGTVFWFGDQENKGEQWMTLRQILGTWVVRMVREGERGVVVDATVSGLCRKAGFGIKGVDILVRASLRNACAHSNVCKMNKLSVKFACILFHSSWFSSSTVSSS
jgi:hypothetical protein